MGFVGVLDANGRISFGKVGKKWVFIEINGLFSLFLMMMLR